MRPAVLHIDSSRGVTGAFRDLQAVMADGAFEHHLVVPETLSERIEGVPVLRLPMLDISRRNLLEYLPRLFANARLLDRYVREQGISLVHVNDMHNLLGILLKRWQPSLTLVYHVRLMPGSYLGRLYHLLKWLVVRYADRILCVSRAVHASWQDAAQAVVSPDRPMMTERHPPPDIREDMPVRFVYVANYTPGKGQDLAIRALAESGLTDAVIEFHGGTLGLAGNETYLAELRELSASLDVASQCHFNGHADDVEVVLKAGDVALNFSESESFSITCLEALYFGVPLIASDCGGPAELFEDGVSGVLVPNRDIKAMTGAMVQLAGDHKARSAMSLAAREIVRARFYAGDRHETGRQFAIALDHPA